jgi:PAS domain S-box-containing protein
MPLSRLDFHSLFAALPSPFMILDRDLRFVEMNDAYLATTKRTRAELIGRYVFDAFPEEPERLALFRDAFERALRGEANELVRTLFRVPKPAEEGGGFRDIYWTCSHAPLRDANGDVAFMIQHAQDVTEQVRAEQLNEVMARELEHRVRNILSVVTSIGRLAGRSATSVEEFMQGFNARLQAMARTYSHLVEGQWSGMDLRTLIENALEPYGEHAGIAITPPDRAIILSPDHAQALSLALHELATNAAKYGALAGPGGRLDVTWQRDGDDGAYSLRWFERVPGGVADASRKGFGSRIIDQALPSQINAEVVREVTPSGLSCTIKVRGRDAPE